MLIPCCLPTTYGWAWGPEGQTDCWPLLGWGLALNRSTCAVCVWQSTNLPSLQSQSHSPLPGSCSRHFLHHLRSTKSWRLNKTSFHYMLHFLFYTTVNSCNVDEVRFRDNTSLPVNVENLAACHISLLTGRRHTAPPPTHGMAEGARLTDGTGALSGMLAQQGHDVGLLGGWAAAADHSRALAGQLHKFMLVVPQADLGDSVVTRLSPHNPGLKQQVSRIVGKPKASSSKQTWISGSHLGLCPRNYILTCSVVQEDKMRRWTGWPGP